MPRGAAFANSLNHHFDGHTGRGGPFFRGEAWAGRGGNPGTPKRGCFRAAERLPGRFCPVQNAGKPPVEGPPLRPKAGRGGNGGHRREGARRAPKSWGSPLRPGQRKTTRCAAFVRREPADCAGGPPFRGRAAFLLAPTVHAVRGPFRAQKNTPSEAAPTRRFSRRLLAGASSGPAQRRNFPDCRWGGGAQSVVWGGPSVAFPQGPAARPGFPDVGRAAGPHRGGPRPPIRVRRRFLGPRKGSKGPEARALRSGDRGHCWGTGGLPQGFRWGGPANRSGSLIRLGGGRAAGGPWPSLRGTSNGLAGRGAGRGPKGRGYPPPTLVRARGKHARDLAASAWRGAVPEEKLRKGQNQLFSEPPLRTLVLDRGARGDKPGGPPGKTPGPGPFLGRGSGGGTVEGGAGRPHRRAEGGPCPVGPGAVGQGFSGGGSRRRKQKKTFGLRSEQEGPTWEVYRWAQGPKATRAAPTTADSRKNRRGGRKKKGRGLGAGICPGRFFLGT